MSQNVLAIKTKKNENKERLQKTFVKDIEIFLKKKMRDNMVMQVTKTSSKMKKINWLTTEKKCYKMRKKRFVIVIRKYFSSEIFASLQGKV